MSLLSAERAFKLWRTRPHFCPVYALPRMIHYVRTNELSDYEPLISMDVYMRLARNRREAAILASLYTFVEKPSGFPESMFSAVSRHLERVGNGLPVTPDPDSQDLLH